MEGRVKEWLSALASADGCDVPMLPPDLQPESLKFLERLAVASTKRNEVELQLAVDAQLRAKQHSAKAAEAEDILQQCGIASESLPTAVSASLGILATVCHPLVNNIFPVFKICNLVR